MEKEVELFDPKFVHFMWDDSLDGKKGFFDDDIETLEKDVNTNTPSAYSLKKNTDYNKGKYPFCSSISRYWQFFYYDPNYEVKWAYYKEGKTVQSFSAHRDKWYDVVGEPSWLDGIEYRVKPEEETVDLSSYLKPKKWTKFNMNYHVKVKLNEMGERLYLEHFTSTCIALSLMKKPDENGYMTFQMHEFMNIFGSHFGPCLQDTPCDMNVLVEAEE